MASKYQYITAVYESCLESIASSGDMWRAFLDTACHNYRLRFDEQVLVFAQKPSATVVMEIENWNGKYNRWVNRGASGIAVFADENRKIQRLKHFFDIQDTHEGKNSRPVPVIEMKPEYQNGIIEALENSFGQLADKASLANAIMSAATNIVEDNISDYRSDLHYYLADRQYEEVWIEAEYSELIKNSIAYMTMRRLGIDVNEHFEGRDFSSVTLFDTPELVTAVGVSARDMSELALTEISRTIQSLEKENRTFARIESETYNEGENQKRSNEYDTDNLHNAGRVQTSGFEDATADRTGTGQIRTDEKEIPERESQDSVLKSPDQLPAERSPAGSEQNGNGDGRKTDTAAESSERNHREIESSQSDGMGAEDEQYNTAGTGDSPERTDYAVEYFDRRTEHSKVPFFHSDNLIKGILKTSPYISAGKEEIADFFTTHKNSKDRIDYLKGIFNNNPTEIYLEGDDTPYGYKTYTNVLHLWSGTYENRLSEGYYDWGVIANYYDGMRIFGELEDNTKPLPTVSQQINLIEEKGEPDKKFVFPQEFIDYVLCGGSGVSHGKMRIYRQFVRSLSRADNVSFLKNEYGIGGHSPVISGTNISEDHDAKGIELRRGYSDNSECLLLKWNDVEKRISELIKADRYLNENEKAEYPEWLEKEQQEELRIEELKRNREILSTAPPETEEKIYEFHLGDKVYLGREEYDIINLTDTTVTLYDYSLPLFNKDMDRAEFEKRIKSNPMNDHLISSARTDAVEIPEVVDDRFKYAKKLIDDFCMLEYGSHADFSDMGKIGVAYTNLGDNEEYEVQANVSLTNYRIWVDVNGEEYTHRQYDNLEDFIKNELKYLDFADLVEVEWELNEHEINVETAEKPAPVIQEPVQFVINDYQLGIGSKKEKYRNNIEAITLLKKIESEDRLATPEEQQILSKYVGWGGISEAFDVNNSSWGSEYLQLKNLLTEEEYSAARESTLTAFYTPPVVINAMYNALSQLGFNNGNILEPACGTGNFIGMLPEEMNGSKFYGIELDDISGKIAKQLYQKSDIKVHGFETADLPDSFFDVIIGNVPFGDFKLSDKRYDKNNFLIHDYFFAKSLDKLRPGGIIAFITSKGTMDKENNNVRKYIAQRAELLGAIRLPDNTFTANAGTTVTSDILFLQKRDRMLDVEPEWVHLGKDENGITMNQYFIDHPEMILGDMVEQSGRFGMETACKAFENTGLSDLLAEAITNIHGEIAEYEIEEAEEDNSIIADPTVRNFSYTVVDGQIYYRENSRMYPAQLSATGQNRVKGLIKIRDSVRNLIELQTQDADDNDIENAQKELNRLYDEYTKEYGLINSRANNTAFSQDSSFNLLQALEVLKDDGTLDRKADLFFKRTIRPHKAVEHCDTRSEALAVSIGEKARIDMEYMSLLTGETEEELYEDLKGVIFLNPEYDDTHNDYKYLLVDEYLSGNVREKLRDAKRKAERSPEDFAIHVQALEKVQPTDLTAAEIDVRLGATWLPVDIVQSFMFQLLDTPSYEKWYIKVHYSELTGEWNIEGKSRNKSNIKVNTTYGTDRVNAYKIIEDTLNLRSTQVFDYIYESDGSKRAVLNKDETAIAQSKQELIKEQFKEWVWADANRRERLTTLYNWKFNSLRPREYDGSRIIFHGMNPEISLRTHQVNAIAHIMYGGNTLLAHAVGAGKTFVMVSAAMEMKQLGLCSKPMFVVPNHLTEQWATEFLQLYPSANILVATKKDFETKNRKKFCGRIATGDYDAIIIGHSQFEKIPMSVERQVKILEKEREEIIEGIIERKANRSDKFSVKQLEKVKKSVEAKLKKLNDQSRKDDVVNFEELGVDRIFVDESHYFKNLYLFTKMRNVGGIAQTEAQKSADLYMKCRYLDEMTGGRGTVFATGTPISNSMVELYTIQRYLQYGTLVKNNLQHFDAWASTFGETVTAIELTPEGTGYRAKTRFAKFYNLPELMSMFKEVADIQTADMLNLPVPKANYNIIAVKPSQIQKDMLADLSTRADRIRNKMVSSNEDNMLLITNDGRKLALDQRLINEMLPDFEGSKINACAENVFKIWKDTEEKKSTQLVFCDLSTPKNDGNFSVYNDIRDKLIAKGVPKEEIKFIHEADTEAKKLELFKKVRSGEVRVLMGSTQKMGAGTNVQTKLVALHDIDCPWRPSDLEQRAGRIIRQGNENEEVNIYRYVTEETFDAYLYQLVEGKQKFASQIMSSKSPVRSAEDIDETALSYAEIKMLATGNPHIKEKMDLDIQVQKLKLLKSNFLSEKYALEDKVIKFYPQEIASIENRIKGYESDFEIVKAHPKSTDDFVGMTVLGVFFDEKAAAGNAILNACKTMKNADIILLGEYRGFKLGLFFDTFNRNYCVRVSGAMSYTTDLGSDVFGNITRIDNTIDGIEKRIEAAKVRLTETNKQYEIAQADCQKPFAYEEELAGKLERLNELNVLLNLDKKENEIVDEEVGNTENEIEEKEEKYER